MPCLTFLRDVSALGSSQYPAAVSARISSGHAPFGIATGRDICRTALDISSLHWALGRLSPRTHPYTYFVPTRGVARSLDPRASRGTSASSPLRLLAVHPRSDASDDFRVAGRTIPRCLIVQKLLNVSRETNQNALCFCFTEHSLVLLAVGRRTPLYILVPSGGPQGGADGPCGI